MPRRGCGFLGLHRKFCFFAQIQLASPSWLASPPVVYKECLVPLFINRLYFLRKSSLNLTFLHIYTDYSGSGWATTLHTLLGFPQSPRSPIGFLCWKKPPIQIDHFWALIEKPINKWPNGGQTPSFLTPNAILPGYHDILFLCISFLPVLCSLSFPTVGTWDVLYVGGT